MSMVPEKLEAFLTECGLTWDAIPRERHQALAAEWQTVYGNCFEFRCRLREGGRAQFEYSQEVAECFMVVPFLSNVGGPHSINKSGPGTAAYQCQGDGRLPDLSSFKDIDFFIMPPDLAWTMIHTHEDHGFGGPYFIRREWVVPPTRKAW